MRFFLTSAKLTGNPDSSGWAQVHDFEPEDEEKIKKRGRLFAVIGIKNHREDSSFGREILTRIHEEYYGDLEISAYNALKKSLEKIAKEVESTEELIEIAAISIIGDVIYSGATGGGEVAIFRDGSLAKILVSTKSETIVASGHPKEKDLLILGTKSFFEIFSGDTLTEAFGAGNPVSATETLAPLVHAKENSGNLGVVIIGFEGEKARFLPKRQIYVKGENPEETKNKRLTLTVGIMLLILLFVSVFFGIRQKSAKDEKARYKGGLSSAQHNFDEAISLVSLNPERARELFVLSREGVDQLLSEKVSDPQVTDLKNKLDKAEGSILGEYPSEPSLFLDLGLISSNFQGDLVSASNEKIFVLDKSGKKVISAAFDSKESRVIAGPEEISDSSGLASYEERVFVQNSTGVDEVGEKRTKVIDKDWQGEALIYAYAGNMYVLDKSGGTILRYPASGKAFSTKQNWLVKSAKVDFSGVKTWTIDGAIYVVAGSGRVLKFSLGSPQNFSVSGVTPNLSTIDAIFTTDELKFIYLLDRAGKRVVVIDKEGKYFAQYTSDKISEATGLAVSEKEKKIILMTGGKLLSIDIKHL